MQPQTPCDRKFREDTNLWTTVKGFLESPDSVPEPEVSWPIWYNEIAIRGLPSQTPCPWKISERMQKVGVTLHCAHVLCQDCSEAHFDRLDSQHLPPACPVCRSLVQHDICGHMIVPKRLPIATFEDVNMVALTLAELPKGKQVLPSECLPCLWSTVMKHMSRGLHQVVQTVRPSSEADLQWNYLSRYVHALVGDFVDDQKKGANWEFMSSSVSSSDASLHVAFIDDVSSRVIPPEIRYKGGDKIVVVPSGNDDQAYWYVPLC